MESSYCVARTWAIGLPGNEQLFSDKALESVWNGTTQIKLISEKETKNNIPKMASLMPEIDLKTQYFIGDHIVKNIDYVSRYSIAAGLEVLKKENINIYDNKQRLIGLPIEYRDRFGIISFSAYNPIHTISEAVLNEIDSSYIFKLSVQASGHMSQILKSQGPVSHINVACASTLYAIDMAIDWLKLNKCDQVLLIGSDYPSHESLFSYIGKGFAKACIASISNDIEISAQPFGKSRNGVIVGSGCIGILLKKENKLKSQDIQVVDTMIFSTGYHVSSLDNDTIKHKLKIFIHKNIKELNITLEELSLRLLYFSHETSSLKCAETELECLRYVFGISFSNILICATKGVTGHSMGVSLEDPISFECLKQKRLPYVNTKELDPSLGLFSLSKGQLHSRSFVLRFSAGFGSFTGFSLYRYVY